VAGGRAVNASEQAVPASVVLDGLTKRYGATIALDGLHLHATGGEILGIAGPNGSGKSTMVGVLAGETPLDDGAITINGAPWTPRHGAEVAVVHQEPQVFPNLSVSENLAVGRERFLVGGPALSSDEHELVEQFGMADVIDQPLGSLPLSYRQRVEIMRGLLQDASVVLFDEPNSALSFDESAELFQHMHDLARGGKVVMLVSHRLGELATHCSRVYVIRDGRQRAELSGERLIPEQIARELVAGHNGAERITASHELGDTVLAVEGWTHHRQVFEDVSLRVAGGEILAVMGVEGAGGRELVRSLAGLEATTGTRDVTGRVEYVTGDRAGSLFSNLTVEENLVLRTAADFAGPLGWWRRRDARTAALRAKDEFGIKTGNVGEPIRSLSGGNQQKVALASALLTEPSVLVLEEPTRGVDVGAKADIYDQLRRHARVGQAAVLYCTEEAEAFECADRIVLVSRGQVVDDVDVRRFTDVEELAEHLSSVTRTDERRAEGLADTVTEEE
jgi:ABC-type sugar transport system ATPase subunit